MLVKIQARQLHQRNIVIEHRVGRAGDDRYNDVLSAGHECFEEARVPATAAADGLLSGRRIGLRS